MKRRVAVGFMGLVLAVATSAPFSYAQPQTSPGSPGRLDSSGMGQEMSARIVERKTKLQTQLTNAEAATVRQNCGAAQAKIAEIGKKFNNASEPVTVTHNSRIANLQRLKQYADTKKIDTQAYAAAVNQYAETHQSYIAAVNTLNLSISDLKGVECANDTTGFMATLQSARNESEQIKKIQAALESQIAAIRPQLEKLKTEFEK